MIFKTILSLLFLIMFMCVGLLIFGAGVMMFLDLNGIIDAPFKYEGEVYSAAIYALIGLAWSGFCIFKLVRSIRNIKAERNSRM